MENVIHVSEMKDGDVGQIVDWTGNRYLGQIVQRYKQDLITVGESKGSSWGDIFNRGQNGRLYINKEEHPACLIQLGKVEFV